MTKPSHPRGPRAGLFACAALAVSVLVPAFVPALVQTARAVPFHTPVINGTITQNAATDWDPADLVVNDVADDNTATRTANLRRLWCTWDETNLYLAVSYQDWGATEALAVYLDLGLGEGPDDASLLDFGAGPLLMPGGGHIDLVLARNPDDSALNVPGPAPEVRLVAADGTTTDITAQVTRAQGFNTGAAQEKASLPFWFNAEFALPWSVLYPDGLPSHAVIKAAAVVNKADTTPPDLAPNNTTVDAATGSIVLEHLHASVIDQDGDGQPDPASGSVAFTVTLPEDNGTAVVTAAAYLDDFAGGDLGAPVATVTGAAGARTLTLPRLTAGRYTITASAEGWVDGSFGVDVAAGEAVTGQALTLDKATAVRGTVGFTRGTGAPGSVAILDQDGATIMTRTFTVAAPDFVMWVQRSGRYTVRASATDHFPAEATLDVTAHVDVDGVSILLEPLPLLSGEVTFASGPGHQGTIALLDEAGEPVRDAANRPVAYGFLASGGPFALHAPYAGHFTLRVVAGPCYVITDREIDVVVGSDIAGLDIVLPETALLSGTVGLEGPDAPGVLRLVDTTTGATMDSLVVTSAGQAFSFCAQPGPHRLDLEALGYVPASWAVDVGLDDIDLGVRGLLAVRADHLEIVDVSGEMQTEVRGTVSLPADDKWFPALVTLAARDAAGRDDLYDLDANLQGFGLSARKMDDLSPARGQAAFWADANRTQPITAVDFRDGRAAFHMTDTAVEVLRVYLAQPAKDPIAGRIIVAFSDPDPRTVLVTADADTVVADGTSTIEVTAQLYDSADNPALLPDIPVTFAVAPTATGGGSFETATVLTNADGRASARFAGTTAGRADLTATVVVNNRVLSVVGGAIGSGEQALPVTVLPGAVQEWRLVLASTVSDLTSPVTVTGQAIDGFGNAVPRAGLSLAFSGSPIAAGSFAPAVAVSDTAGRAVSVFTPAGQAGLVTIAADGGAYGQVETGLRLRDVFVVSDAPWYAEPADRQVFPPTDLTALIVDNTPDELILEIPFASDWGGLQLHVIFETAFDAGGATVDPFVQPVNYAHAQKPDYAITCKYSANDYGDFRRFNKVSNGWEWYDPATDSYNSSTGSNIMADWTQKSAGTFIMRIPFTAFEGRIDSLKVEAYITQDDSGVKRAAFDSAPQDATLNLTFDYTDPGPNDWQAALGPTTLSAWSPTYVRRTDFPTPPALTNVTATPAEVDAGGVLTVTARVTDGGDGVGDVLADLSDLGGSGLLRMYDDGQAGHGDATAGDGNYAARAIVPLGNPGGRQSVVVRAYDAGNVLPREAEVEVVVIPDIEPLVLAVDPVGDDHGPNQPGVDGMYYIYPTNIVFGAGSFDLEQLTVFETTVTIGGQPIDMIAFQVKLGDFPDPADPQSANWGAPYADINIQKIDILIDSAPGGATATLPNRQAAFQPWDAWEYAIIIDGWYKAVVPSLGQNSLDSWIANAKRTDQDILLLSDPELDTITALVSKAVLGDPTPEDIRSWDMAVLMCSHDSNGELGGLRWVDRSRSEWRLGGGHDSNRDANVIDLLTVAGTGHQPGPPQEELLDYESPQAVARLEQDLTPVAIEMSQFEDTGPPVIDVGTGGKVLTTITPLEGAGVAMAVTITDDYRVDRATLRYRSTGFTGDGWDREVALGALANNVWVTDVLPDWLDSNLVYSPIDSTRYLEFEVQAWDALGKDSSSPVTTMQLLPARSCIQADATLDAAKVSLLQVDGAGLVVSDPLRAKLLDAHRASAWTGGDVTVDALAPATDLVFDLCNVPERIWSAPQVPPARPLGVFRSFYLATRDSAGGWLDQSGRLPGQAQFSLHYPQPWVPAGLDEQKIGLYEYAPASDRWVLVGGNTTPGGNNVTATVDHTGIYGLFATEALGYTTGEVISGITISPNPFSPNDDGLYDETTISFYLDREATVTVEIYNINGDRKRVLTETFSYAGSDEVERIPHRVPGLIWDGRDTGGNIVPYGVYVMRILTTYNQAGGTRTIRSNHSLAVIK